jgi:hypothetical protein
MTAPSQTAFGDLVIGQFGIFEIKSPGAIFTNYEIAKLPNCLILLKEQHAEE